MSQQCFLRYYNPVFPYFRETQPYPYPMTPYEVPNEPVPQEAPQGVPQGVPQAPNKQPMPPSNFEVAPGSPTTLGIQYTEGYLKTQIGKRVKITFLIGTNIIQDRTGILAEVGISYVILKEAETNSRVLCDMYSIKFVNIYD